MVRYLFNNGDEIANKYKIIKPIGKGGNGEVYEVEKINEPKNKLALKLINLNIKNYYRNKKSKERIKYKRFISEIDVVINNQDSIKGILPILDINKPENPSNDNLPWYVMPIAKPMIDEIKDYNLEQKVKVILELCKVLKDIHSKYIAHRDIKPQNIYYYNNRWVISDFGLVYYPKKDKLTRVNESVGPKATIAPEMKRYPTEANPILADIYSMAKTLWIILTGEIRGVDGQYNEKNEFISLNRYIKNEYLITLNKFITLATLDIPEKRLSAEGAIRLLEEWLEEKNDWKKQTEKEWNYIINDIAPYKPETVEWTDYKQIANVLNIISKTYSLNHMFMPSGGGMDLIGCNVSNRKGFIELNEGGIIKLVKPKKLYMEIIGEYEWNYFYLQTEEIPLTGIYNYEDKSLDKVYYEPVLELGPNEYINNNYNNYGEYNGKKLPEKVRSILIGIKGDYVIFPKNSFYNLNIKSYSAIQTRYKTPENFKKFIIDIKKFKEWIYEHPEEYSKMKAEKEEKERLERNKYREKKKKELLHINEKFKQFELSDRNENEVDNKENFVYTIQGYIEVSILEDRKFYIDKNKNIFIKKSGFEIYDLDDTKEANLKRLESMYLFKSAKSAEESLYKINEFYKKCTLGLDKINRREVAYIKSYRIKKPKHLFTKEELIDVIKNGDDSKSNILVIDKHGYLKLVDLLECKFKKEHLYSVIGFEFYPGENRVGKLAHINDEIDDLYNGMLYSWKEHLRSGKTITLPDYWGEVKVEEILQDIRNYCDMYED